jgi:dihydroxyacetone kinase-like protein
MTTSLIVACLEAVHTSIIANEPDIESLDRAIGDGDHYLNVRRGCQALLAIRQDLAGLAPADALNAMGMKLLSTIGGASGPLISSFFIAMGKCLRGNAKPSRADIAYAFAAGVDSIKHRGKADVGEKTMLDVLIPVSRLLAKLSDASVPLGDLCGQINEEATRSMLATRDMIATKGRAHYLGERALGHIDPGCKTCEVNIAAVTETVLAAQSRAAA